MFAYRRCSGPSQFLNSVLRIRRHFASPLVNCDHHFSTLLRPSQLFSIFATLFSSSQSCSISSHLSSTLFSYSLLFSTFLNDSHLCPPRLNSSQLFSPLATSSTLPTSSHLRSTHLTSFSPHLNPSHLLNSGQPFSTLLASCHRDAYTQSKLLHGRSIYTQQALTQRSSYTQKLLHKASFYIQQAFATRSFYT